MFALQTRPAYECDQPRKAGLSLSFYRQACERSEDAACQPFIACIDGMRTSLKFWATRLSTRGQACRNLDLSALHVAQLREADMLTGVEPLHLSAVGCRHLRCYVLVALGRLKTGRLTWTYWRLSMRRTGACSRSRVRSAHRHSLGRVRTRWVFQSFKSPNVAQRPTLVSLRFRGHFPLWLRQLARAPARRAPSLSSRVPLE